MIYLFIHMSMIIWMSCFRMENSPRFGPCRRPRCWGKQGWICRREIHIAAYCSICFVEVWCFQTWFFEIPLFCSICSFCHEDSQGQKALCFQEKQLSQNHCMELSLVAFWEGGEDSPQRRRQKAQGGTPSGSVIKNPMKYLTSPSLLFF